MAAASRSGSVEKLGPGWFRWRNRAHFRAPPMVELGDGFIDILKRMDIDRIAAQLEESNRQIAALSVVLTKLQESLDQLLDVEDARNALTTVPDSDRIPWTQLKADLGL
jgi:hypothetical protein